MKTIERKEIALKEILPHPHNREFPTTGAEWDDFEDDIAQRGIEEDLEVRLLPDGGYQCLKGHRRRHAGLARGVEMAWCSVKSGTDEEAYQAVWRANMRRENLTAYDEAVGVAGMVELFGKTPEEISADWNRSLDWVRTRQRLLELGDEVIDAVRRPGRDRLSIGAVEEILKVPQAYWAEAVQLVLYPVYEPCALSEEQAREVLKRCLIEPKAREVAWEGQREKLGKAWRKALGKLCQKGTKEELAVQVRALPEALKLQRGYEDAEAVLPLAEVLPAAPAGLRWLHLAVRHGLAVQVVPGEGPGESRAVVDGCLIREAEAAAAEHGGTAWLVVGKKRVEKEVSEEAQAKGRVAAAVGMLDGQGEAGYEDGEAPEKVISQAMEHRAWIDMGTVKKVALWAVSGNADPMDAPDYVPKWACRLGVEGLWLEIDQVVNWVISLKGKSAE